MPSEKNEEAEDDDENAFFAKLSVLSNNSVERIQEQVKQICKAADQIDKYIEMLRGTGLNYTADSMARNTAEIKLHQKVILQIVEEMHQQQEQQEEEKEEEQQS
jgi:uncharacterized protein (DUF924 family)